MSVYVEISYEELASFLEPLNIGKLLNYEGITVGIENSNFFVSTEQGEFVLTLFEQMGKKELPFFLGLNKQLHKDFLPTACAISDNAGEKIFELKGRPSILVPRLLGESPETPTLQQCESIGLALGRMHKSLRSFRSERSNTRDLGWMLETAEKVLPLLGVKDAALLKDELEFQQEQSIDECPKGIIHADLFRDNTLFVGGDLTGLLDFYFASKGVFLFDIAVTVNDWCILDDGSLDEEREWSLLRAYEQERPLEKTERSYWPVALRLAALRFWLSRLEDVFFPKSGAMVLQKAPNEFKQILIYRRGLPFLCKSKEI